MPPEYKPNAPTPGSYGHAIMTLAQGLQIAVEQGWVSEDEARNEFRSNVRTLVALRDRKLRAAELRYEADELDGEEELPI